MELDNVLQPIWDKIQHRKRLDIADARTLYAHPDLLTVGWMAKQVKEKRWGKKAFYVFNQKLEPTNICVLSCKFCDFAIKRNHPNAYEMTIEEMVAKCAAPGIREIHISGGTSRSCVRCATPILKLASKPSQLSKSSGRHVSRKFQSKRC
jgi:aminodeoxyfutalosine synthase